MVAKLGINLDHIAGVRELRGELYPSVVDAAKVCLMEGADSISIYLRQDRKHIQDTDVEAVSLVAKKYGKPLNLKIGCNKELLEVAVAVSPCMVTIVSENTENCHSPVNEQDIHKMSDASEFLRSNIKNIKIGFSLDANVAHAESAIKLSPDFIDINTTEFAKDCLSGNDLTDHLNTFQEIKKIIEKTKISLCACGGLTDECLPVLNCEHIFDEVKLGHYVISRSIFDGLKEVVHNLKKILLDESHLKE